MPLMVTIQGVKFERYYQVTKSMCLKTLRKLYFNMQVTKNSTGFFWGGDGVKLSNGCDLQPGANTF